MEENKKTALMDRQTFVWIRQLSVNCDSRSCALPEATDHRRLMSSW